MGIPNVLKKIKHLIFIFFTLSISMASSSTIKGVIRDSNTNEPLIGANIMLMDTNFGIASDFSPLII